MNAMYAWPRPASAFLVPPRFAARVAATLAIAWPGVAGLGAESTAATAAAPSAAAAVRPVDFDTQVVPIFTKHGCNGGGCHGKSGGQNGFRLSLLGFEPGEDHDHLVKEARGRRISVAAPGLPPSPVCDDATFLRRVTLDIAGRLPTLDESRAFLVATDAAKRDRLVDRLLDSPDYADHFAMKWSAILRNKRTNDDLHRHGSYSFHEWIRDSLDRNVPYSDLVRGVLAASGEVGENPAVVWFRQAADINQQVEDASQLFLGLRLQCARCHHHPFESWGTEDYFQLAGFFSRVGKKPGLQPGEDRIFHNRGPARAAGPKGTHPAAVLGGKPAALTPDDDPRLALVDWMTAPDNPYFARALVNRYWKHFFGRGLVDPEDDMRLTNPATNPALLDALASHFVAHGFDLKDLIRVICRSTTYQLSAEPNEYNAADRQSFSRFYPRRLPAEVALDAIDRLTGKPTGFPGVLPGTRAVQLPDPGFTNHFLTIFGRPNADSACECERGGEANLAQSLHLINSADILAKLTGGRAAALAADTTRDTAAKLDELYLVAVSRPATAEERQSVEAYLASHADNAVAAWEDVVWSLLNTKEFLFTHELGSPWITSSAAGCGGPEPGKALASRGSSS